MLKMLGNYRCALRKWWKFNLSKIINFYPQFVQLENSFVYGIETDKQRLMNCKHNINIYDKRRKNYELILSDFLKLHP